MNTILLAESKSFQTVIVSLILVVFTFLPFENTNAQNCVNSTLTASAGNDSPLCIGQNINLMGNSNGVVTYAWSGPNGFVSTLQNPILPNVTPLAQGTYNVVVTNKLGCTATASTNVIVNGQGTAGCNCLSLGCEDYANFIFNGTFNQIADPANLIGDTWRINNVAPGVDAQMKIIGQKNAYQVQNIDNDGVGVVVRNNWSPELGFNLVPNDSSYVDWEINLFASGTNNPASLSKSSRVSSMDVDGNNDYREFHGHLNTNGFVANNPTELTFFPSAPFMIVGGSMIEHNGISDDPEVKATFYYPQTTTMYKIRLGVLGSATASGSVPGRQYAISFNPCQDYSNPVTNPVFPIVSGVTTVCPSDLVQNYSLNTNFPNISWSVVGGNITSGQGTPNITVNWTNTGVQTVTATTTDANGCVFADQKFVNVLKNLTIDLTANKTVCIDNKAEFTSTVTGGSGSYAYQWQSSMNNISNFLTGWSNINGATTSKFTANTSNPGTIAYRLLVTDTKITCSPIVSAIRTVIVNPSPANVSITGGDITCINRSVQLIGNSTTPNVTYSWTSSSQINGVNSQTITTNAFGTYNLKVTSNATGCSALATTFVKLDTTPIVVNATGGVINCNNPSIKLFANANRINLSYAWSSSNGFTSNQTNPIVSNSGIYNVTATNPVNGCKASAQTIVTQSLNAPNVVAIGDNLTCSDPLAQLSASSTLPNAIFEWTGPGGFVFRGQMPMVGQIGNYNVVAVNPANGCKSTVAAIAAVTKS
jgi:hypothetical protein